MTPPPPDSELPEEPHAAPEKIAEHFVQFVRGHAALLLAATLAVCLGSGYVASHLQLRTDFAELLPSHDASVQELRRVQARLPGTEALIVNIYAGDKKSHVLFADKLVERLRRLPADLIGVAVANIKNERTWFEQRQGLYMSQADLVGLRDRLAEELQRIRNPFYVDLESTGAKHESLGDMEKRLAAGSLGPSIAGRFPDGYFVTDDGTTAMVVILPPGGMFHEHAGERLRNEVQRIVAELQPDTANVEIGYSGDIESGLEERDALENDLVWATGLCIVLVCAVVFIFFGRYRALPLMAMPAFIGTLVAYAVAQMAFGYLTSSTAFLGSIIIGNGINFAIIQMARYEEERRLGRTVADALTRAVSMTMRATAIAAIAASISYGSLMVTQFRGFSQFGIIGGVGMIMAWLATIVVLPAALWLLDRNETGPLPARRSRNVFFAEPLAKLALDKPRIFVACGLLLTIVAFITLPRYLNDPFEYNFRNLRSAVSDNPKRGEGRWQKPNGEVFGRTLNPFVVLVHDPQQIEPTRQALRDQDAKASGAPMIDKIVAVEDLVPGSVASQTEKLPLIAEIRTLLTGPEVQKLSPRQRKKFEALIPPADLQPVTLADLPPLLRRPFTELDGTMGNVLLIFPKIAGFDPSSGRDMIRLSERVDEIKPVGLPAERSVGTAVLFVGMLRSILRDGPLATMTSALGVVILVFVLLRRGIGGAALVLGTLLAGFAWMIGAAAALNIKINFLNFVALPVTLGIGVDYGVNIYLRSKLEGPGRLLQTVRATGGAVALCSATTIIGYGALLVADNRALRSFGTLAILGEVACLSAALILMPAMLAMAESKGPPAP